MPIAASMSVFQSQILSALSLGPAANGNTTAALIAAGLAAGIPAGIFPTAPTPVPLAPSGVSAAQSGIAAAFSMGPAAQMSTVAQMIAQAISAAAPTAPPSGMSSLASTIESALSMGPAANPNTVAQMIAAGIVQYYLMGGVV